MHLLMMMMRGLLFLHGAGALARVSHHRTGAAIHHGTSLAMSGAATLFVMHRAGVLVRVLGMRSGRLGLRRGGLAGAARTPEGGKGQGDGKR